MLLFFVPDSNSTKAFKPTLDITDDIILKTNKDGSTTLTHMSPDYHGFRADISSDGVLGFDIRANGDPELFGTGQDMFYGMMNRLEKEGVEVNQIRGWWNPGDVHDSVNFNQFNSAIDSGKSKVQAAMETWTGKRANEYGFGNVVSVENVGSAVVVLFGRSQ